MEKKQSLLEFMREAMGEFLDKQEQRKEAEPREHVGRVDMVYVEWLNRATEAHNAAHALHEEKQHAIDLELAEACKLHNEQSTAAWHAIMDELGITADQRTEIEFKIDPESGIVTKPATAPAGPVQ